MGLQQQKPGAFFFIEVTEKLGEKIRRRHQYFTLKKKAGIYQKLILFLSQNHEKTSSKSWDPPPRIYTDHDTASHQLDRRIFNHPSLIPSNACTRILVETKNNGKKHEQAFINKIRTCINGTHSTRLYMNDDPGC